MDDGTNSHEVRTSELADFANDRRSSVDEETGFRWIVIGGVFYSEFPPGDGMPMGKRWVSSGGSALETDGEKLFEQSRARTSDDGSMTSSHVFFVTPDPTPEEYLEYLRESGGEPELLGEEDVRGVTTTRYRATLDEKQVLRAQLEAEGWKVANIERYLETMVRTEQELDLWVDAAGLARRVVKTTDSEGVVPPGMTHRSVTTTEYFDFGVEAEIEPPPVAEVIDSDEWQRITEERTPAEAEEPEQASCRD